MLPVYELSYLTQFFNKKPKSDIYLTKSASFLETLGSLLKMGKLGISEINPS